MKLVFIPFSLATGLLAGVVGRRIFSQLWSAIDDEEPPEPEHRDAPWGKLLLATALQGAIFRATRAVADRGLRSAFVRTTGSWPGEEQRDRTG